MSTMSIKELFRPNPWRWLFYVSCDWILIILAFFAAHEVNTLFSYWLASLLIGNRQHAIAILGHDGAHYTISRNKRLNNILTALFTFYPLAMSLKGYRKMHFAHHANTGTEHDPELKHKAQFTPQFDLPFRKKHLGVQLVKDLLGYDPRMFISLAAIMRPQKLYYYLGPALFQAIFWAICIITHSYWVLALWYFSLMTSFIVCFRLRIWIEHIGTSNTHRVSLKPWQQFLFAPHQTANHFEHHKWPWIPFWNLPKARSFDTTTPIMNLSELIAYYESASKNAEAQKNNLAGPVSH